MIYIVFACFCVFFAFSLRLLMSAGRHDRVLFPFCQLRRDIMAFLYQNAVAETNKLTLAEYRSVRRLLDALNDTINNYSEHKTTMFNLRHVLKALQKYRHTLKQVEPVDFTENTEIQQFHQRFVQCCARAFLTYTPLIRWEFVLRLAIFIWRERRKEAVLKDARQVHADLTYGGPLDTPAPA